MADKIQPDLGGDPTTQIPTIPSTPPAPRELSLPLPQGGEVSGDALRDAFGVSKFK